MDERREEVRRVESGEESVIETILSDEVIITVVTHMEGLSGRCDHTI